MRYCLAYQSRKLQAEPGLPSSLALSLSRGVRCGACLAQGRLLVAPGDRVQGGLGESGRQKTTGAMLDPQHGLPLAQRPGGVHKAAVPGTFGLGRPLLVQLPVALLQVVGREGQGGQYGGGPPLALHLPLTEAAVRVVERGFRPANEPAVDFPKLLVELLRGEPLAEGGGRTVHGEARLELLLARPGPRRLGSGELGLGEPAGVPGVKTPERRDRPLARAVW